MVQPVVGHRIGPNQQLEPIHSLGQPAQRRRGLARSMGLGHIAPQSVGNPQQEGARAGRGVQDVNLIVRDAVGLQVRLQRPVQRAHHVPHHFDGRVVDAVPLPRGRIEGLQEILVEIEDGVGAILSHAQDRRIKAIDRLQHDVEARADLLGHLRHAEHLKRSLHQRMLGRHVISRVAVYGRARRLPYQQQTKRKGLGEGCREQVVEVPR